MNVFGGEDRFWLGPEGGQFSIYFPPKKEFELAHWQVPEMIDWGGWEVASQSERSVSFRKEATLTNYSGTAFSVRVDRTVRLVDAKATSEHLGGALEGLRFVTYESENTITNTGEAAWEKRASGLLSVWILSMYNPSPTTTVVIPFVPGDEATLGPVVNDAYFGKVPADRLVVTDGVLFFRGDGQQRGKIGIPRPRAKPVMGSFDAANRVLTLVQYTLPEKATDYVNSMWEIQDKPYGGDVVNSYNDGPAGTRQTTAGALLRTRVIIAGGGPRTGREPDPRSSHLSSGGRWRRARRGSQAAARRRTRADRGCV